MLVGDLGSGKTQFTKGLAFGLGIKDHITSPTFIYQNIYKGKSLKLYHFDLYRNEVVDEDIKNLIKEAYSDPKGVTVIEWAEHEKDNWPPRYRLLKFLWLSENDRKIELKLASEDCRDGC